MLNIRKTFPGIVANDDITLQLKSGEIHALLGENGAIKSTLISVLFGLHFQKNPVHPKLRASPTTRAAGNHTGALQHYLPPGAKIPRPVVFW